MKRPTTLQQAILYFANTDNCIRYMVDHRWPQGVFCPTCGRKDVTWLENQKKWQCKSSHAKRQFTAKVGTIFEDSPLGLEKWLPAVWLIATAKNGVSSCEIARSLGVTQKTAWFMLHRIRKAMANGSMMKIGGNGGVHCCVELVELGISLHGQIISERNLVKLIIALFVCASVLGCSRNRQRFVPVVVPGYHDDIIGNVSPDVLILDTQTGQWCKGSDKPKSSYPLCHDLYTGKIK